MGIHTTAYYLASAVAYIFRAYNRGLLFKNSCFVETICSCMGCGKYANISNVLIIRLITCVISSYVLKYVNIYDKLLKNISTEYLQN